MLILKHKGLKKLSKPELVYVGMTDKQTVSERLLGNHAELQAALRDMDDRPVVIAKHFSIMNTFIK